ncbi:hypothetical protein V6Z11_A08G138000 [Gossypium hirsutum]|uniref:Uncharacterized protein n=1 Tax=Gossypium tomentosum TaxID=34277 RepID=A0A5D2PFJ8_GOSTO|nr:hypothetical protein ES332_A08G139200v1 [Gossypium tomentosum]
MRCSKIWQSHRLHRAIFTRSKKSHSFPRWVSGDSRAGIENPLEWLFSSSLASNYQDLHLLLFSYTKAIYRKPR